MKRYLRILATALTGLSIASTAFAVTSVPTGWYLEGNVGTTRQNDRTYPAGSSTSSSGLGANVNLGYKFMPFMGLELGYTRYADVVIKNSVGTKAANDRHYVVDLAVKGILPVADSGLEAFAKIGYHRINSSITIVDSTSAAALGISQSSRNAKGIYMGLGGQFYFAPELAMVVQWQKAKGSNVTGSMNFYSIGMSFIFD